MKSVFVFVLGFVFVFVILKGKIWNFCVYEIYVCICVRICVCVCDCDFEREIQRSETCVSNTCVCVCVCVCVVIWGWAGRNGASGAHEAGLGLEKKNPFIKRGGFGKRVLARGPSEHKETRSKPDPLPFLPKTFSYKRRIFRINLPALQFKTHFFYLNNSVCYKVIINWITMMKNNNT